MALANHERSALAVFVPDGRGGYETPSFERDIGGGYSSSSKASCSAEGYRQMVWQADLFDAERETFEALTPHLGRCEHGDDIAELIDDGTLRWTINDYCCDYKSPGATLFWMLWGMHQDGQWCFAKSFVRGVLGDYGASSCFTPLLDLDGDYNIVAVSPDAPKGETK